jgi:hypothetical protein
MNLYEFAAPFWQTGGFLIFLSSLPQVLQSYWVMKCIKKREALNTSCSASPNSIASPAFLGGSNDKKHIDTKSNLVTLSIKK